METIVSGTIGQIHLTFSVIALITGLFVLTTTKGTKRHKQIGYVYFISMITLNITAFMIYRHLTGAGLPTCALFYLACQQSNLPT